jgi:hypothetical protein
MKSFARTLALCLLAAVPAVAVESPLVPQPTSAQGRAEPAQPGPGKVEAYVPPGGLGPVYELLDEGVEPLFPLLINDGGGEVGTITREDRDVFAGVEAVRVLPLQKYATRLPGWNFKVVEEPKPPPGPKAPIEVRYLRFAWKKTGGQGIMVQFHDPVKSWAMRYIAGQNVVGWNPAVSVSDRLPAEWEVVTRDLFKEHGTFNLTGVAFTAMYGEPGDYALFDHILLGRTLEDLDKATDLALGRVKPAKPLAGTERDALWNDLLGADRPKATAAIRAFLAAAPDQVKYIGSKLAVAEPDKELGARVRNLVTELDSDEFDTRDRATDELVKIGAPAVDRLRALAEAAPSDEVRFRARVVLKKLGADGAPLSNSGRMARVVRVLDRAGTDDARELLKRMADGEFGPGGGADARAALARRGRKP